MTTLSVNMNSLPDGDVQQHTKQISSTIPVALYACLYNKHNFVYGTPNILHGVENGEYLLLSYDHLRRISDSFGVSVSEYIETVKPSDVSVELLSSDEMTVYKELKRIRIDDKTVEPSEPFVVVVVPNLEAYSLEDKRIRFKYESWFERVTKYMRSFETQMSPATLTEIEHHEDYFTGTIDSHEITVPKNVNTSMETTVAVPYCVWNTHKSYFNAYEKWALDMTEFWMVKLPIPTKTIIKRKLTGANSFSLSREDPEKTYGADYYNKSLLYVL